MTRRNAILILLSISFLLALSCKKIDNTSPVITLIGPELIYHELNQTYNDPGVTVTDETDENIEAVADIGVDENKTGIYDVIYTAVDKGGNSSQAYRTVIVYNIADTLNGTYFGNCTKPYPNGVEFLIDNENVFADSLINNKVWFSNFATYDSCFVYMLLSDSIITIPDQTVTVVIDSAIDVSFRGICILNDLIVEIDFTEKIENDSIVCRTVLEPK